jgi:hypothetical protein
LEKFGLGKKKLKAAMYLKLPVTCQQRSISSIGQTNYVATAIRKAVPIYLVTRARAKYILPAERLLEMSKNQGES